MKRLLPILLFPALLLATTAQAQTAEVWRETQALCFGHHADPAATIAAAAAAGWLTNIPRPPLLPPSAWPDLPGPGLKRVRIVPGHAFSLELRERRQTTAQGVIVARECIVADVSLPIAIDSQIIKDYYRHDPNLVRGKYTGWVYSESASGRSYIPNNTIDFTPFIPASAPLVLVLASPDSSTILYEEYTLAPKDGAAEAARP